jgi:hypothetical protein
MEYSMEYTKEYSTVLTRLKNTPCGPRDLSAGHGQADLSRSLIFSAVTNVGNVDESVGGDGGGVGNELGRPDQLEVGEVGRGVQPLGFGTVFDVSD